MVEYTRELVAQEEADASKDGSISVDSFDLNDAFRVEQSSFATSITALQ